MRKHKNKIITFAVITIVLVFAFCYGGDVPKPNEVVSKIEKSEEMSKNTVSQKEETSVITRTTVESPPDTSESSNEPENTDEYMNDFVPDVKLEPFVPEETKINDNELTCSLSVKCDTILQNIEWFDNEKVDIVPKEGIIFSEKTVTFYEGESVFNVLVREMKRNSIHLEFVNIPIYNSAYIEGIANIYEFDCGELSGWMYKVNGWFPNYGCSRYQLKDGDKVEWVYTCNLGVDVGGSYSARNGN